MNKTPEDMTAEADRTFAPEEIAAMRPVLRRLLRDHVIADVMPAAGP